MPRTKPLIITLVFIVIFYMLNADFISADENKNIPSWIFNNSGVLQKSTGGLGSTLIDDPGYILWKPSLSHYARKSGFALDYLKTDIEDGALKRTDIIAHHWEMLNYGFSAGFSNRKTDYRSRLMPINASTAQTAFSLGLNRKFAGFGQDDDLWFSMGLTGNFAMENYSFTDSTAIYAFPGLHAVSSWKNWVSAGLDLYGAGWEFKQSADEDSASANSSWSSEIITNPTLHLGSYFTVPETGIDLLDRNLVLSWGIQMCKGRKSLTGYGISYRVPLEIISPPNKLITPLSLTLNAGYRENEGSGYGFKIGYDNFSLVYAWAAEHSSEHYIGFSFSFGKDRREERRQKDDYETISRKRFIEANKKLSQLISGKYLTSYQINGILNDIRESVSRCEINCGPKEQMNKFVRELKKLQQLSARHLNEDQYDKREGILEKIDTLIFRHREIEPSFIREEKKFLTWVESAERILGKIDTFFQKNDNDISKLRSLHDGARICSDSLQEVKGKITDHFAEVMQISPDSVRLALEKSIADDDIARLDKMDGMISDLSSARDRAYSLFVIESGSQKIEEILPYQHLAKNEASEIGTIAIHNHNSHKIIKDVTINMMCNDTINMWRPEPYLVNEIMPGERVEAPLKIIPTDDFFCSDSTRRINAEMNVSFTLDEKLFIDRMDSLMVTVKNPRLLSPDIDSRYLPHLVDSDNRLIKGIKDFIHQSLRNMEMLYDNVGEAENLFNRRAIVAMAVMNFMVDNMPASSQGETEKTDDEYIYFSRFDEMLREGPGNIHEKAILTISILKSLDVPADLVIHRDQLLVAIDKNDIENRYKENLFSNTDKGSFIPLLIRLERDRFLDALEQGQKLISEYNRECEAIAVFSKLKNRLLEAGKDELLAQKSVIDSAMILVSRPYNNGVRTDNNPYLNKEEEITIREKLAFVLNVHERYDEMRMQFIRLLCLDHTRDWLEETGMKDREAFNEWQSAKDNYSQNCTHTEDSEQRFVIISMDSASDTGPTISCDYGKIMNFNFNPGPLHEEYNRLIESYTGSF